MRSWPDSNGSAIDRFLQQRRIRHPQTPQDLSPYTARLPGRGEAMRAFGITGQPPHSADMAARGWHRVVASSVLHRACIINRFLEFLAQEGSIASNPIAELRTSHCVNSSEAILRALLATAPDRALEALRQLPRFGSVVGDLMRNHVARMRTRGFRYDTNARMFLRFDRFLQRHPDLVREPLPVMLQHWADPNIFVVTPDGFSRPSPHRALQTAEIAVIVEQYRPAAVNAKRAGFDGVEVMAANGHLIDQFLQDNSNKRTDRYGRSIENRTRLLVEVVEASISLWGADWVGVRIAPSGTFNGMADSNPRALFRYVVERLNDFGLAYLHVIEPRIKGADLVAEGQGPVAAQELSKIFQGPIIAAGGFEPDTAEATVANGDASMIAFGRHFIGNPDLPKRIELGLPLNHYDRSTFYAFDARGYTDYPAYEVHEAIKPALTEQRQEGPGGTAVRRATLSYRSLVSQSGANENG